MPIVQTMSLDRWRSLPGSPVNDVRVFVLLSVYNLHSVKDFELLSDDSVSPANDIPIPFLPLSSHFNYNKRTDWEMLSKQIEKMANQSRYGIAAVDMGM